MSVERETLSDPDWVPTNEDFVEARDDVIYTLGVWRDNDKPFKLLYQKRDGTNRYIYCRSDWKWSNNEKTMIAVYDTENQGNRTLYVDNILDYQKLNDDLMNFLQSHTQTPFVINYQKKNGTTRDIYCSSWKWAIDGTHISVYDTENKGVRTLLVENILEWCEQEEEQEEEQTNDNLSNNEFNVILDGLYECVGWKWENGDYNGAMSMMNHMQRVMMTKMSEFRT
jgi:hypothetical protein